MTDRADEPALGLEQRRVLLVPHDPRWAELFEAETARIRVAMGETLVALEHFGSTSIPGIRAKPIIDMLGGVRALDDALGCRAALEAIGYEHAAWAGVPGHHVFGKGRPRRTHLLHLVEHGGASWTENLHFRDRLRASPDLAAEYDRLKARLAESFPEDRPRYTDEKAAFVQRIRRGGS
jgi:GrpB-like predicted nucleotidyltransferase (UPF0157 family)